MSKRIVQSFVAQKNNPVISVKTARRNRAASIERINDQTQRLYKAFTDPDREWKPAKLRKIIKSLNAFQRHLSSDRREIMKNIAVMQNAKEDPIAEISQLEDTANLAANVDSLLVTARTSFGEDLQEEDLVLVDDSGVVQEEEPMVDRMSVDDEDMMEDEVISMEDEEMNDKVDLEMEIDEATTDAEIASVVRKAYARLKVRVAVGDLPSGTPVEDHPDDPKKSNKKAEGMPEGQPVDQHADDLPDVPESGNPEKVEMKNKVEDPHPNTAISSDEADTAMDDEEMASMEEDEEEDFMMGMDEDEDPMDDFMAFEDDDMDEEMASEETASVKAKASVSKLRRKYAKSDKNKGKEDPYKAMISQAVMGNFSS